MMSFMREGLGQRRPDRSVRAIPVAVPSWVLALLALEAIVGAALRCLDDSRTPTLRAYIDPGSGAVLVQVLLSAFFGLLLYFKRARGSLRRLLPWPRRPGGGTPGQPPAE